MSSSACLGGPAWRGGVAAPWVFSAVCWGKSLLCFLLRSTGCHQDLRDVLLAGRNELAVAPCRQQSLESREEEEYGQQEGLACLARSRCCLSLTAWLQRPQPRS